MDSIYVRYASALLSIAKDENKIEQYKEVVKDLLVFFASNVEANNYLKSYFVKDEQKFDVVDEITKGYKIENLSSFLKLLVKRHRFNSFKYIANEFIKSSNEEIGIFEGYVYSTKPLDEKQIASIESAISKKFNNKVELVNRIDERLIGGVKVVVHDHVFDGSIKNKLETMKTKINERRKA